jgi:hypothetical protein
MSVARDAVAQGRLAKLATVESTHAGVYALYPDGVTAELARQAVKLLIDSAQT